MPDGPGRQATPTSCDRDQTSATTSMTARKVALCALARPVVRGRDMSGDWMKALADAFSVHSPQCSHEPYFEDCFSHHVEERHADESLAVPQWSCGSARNCSPEPCATLR
jgi:hypothetical protein